MGTSCTKRDTHFTKIKLALLMFISAGVTSALASEANNFTRLRDIKAEERILSSENQKLRVKAGVTPSSIANRSISSLLLGYPLDLVGESHMFGGVVIKVSDKTDETLGNIKLASVTAPVRTQLVNTTEKKALLLRGQFGASSETQPSVVVLEIPITEINQQEGVAYLDLAAIGRQMNIVADLNTLVGEGLEGFTLVESRTVAVDFSLKTLVFDVESAYVVSSTDTQNVVTSKNVTITTRYFMRLNSMLDPFFERRAPTEGVGYFLTNFDSGWISRFSIHDLATNPIKYYVKNVPLEYRTDMLSGFEDWNHKLQETLGQNLLTYEVLEKDDPRFEQIVIGDPRYNVLEWDVDNLASYGGLGPSLKNSLTGQLLSGQVYIQGPTIVEIYKQWFKVNDEVASLRARGLNAEASLVQKQFIQKVLQRSHAESNKQKINVHLGQALKFSVPALDPSLQDATAVDPLDFLQIPAGHTYETYMHGYWREIVAHELGHNLGLRHNFRGSLKDGGSGTVGSVSRSVMEYLPRTHRHLNRVSEYDIMAIAYGYLGRMPEHLDWFCTDGDMALFSANNSAECSNSDATNDPVSFYESRIQRGLDLLLARQDGSVPVWTIDDVAGTMVPVIANLASYAYTAPATAAHWTNFFGKLDRPQLASDVPNYILQKLDQLICSPDLDAIVNNKPTPEAKAQAAENLTQYRNMAFSTLNGVPSAFNLLSPITFSCLLQ